MTDVQRVRDCESSDLDGLLARFELTLCRVGDDADIPASFWGEPEAGVKRQTVYVRGDTPLHSLLHEASHIVCMTPRRRHGLDTDAGGDDLEEAAVCYLQILLADQVDGCGRSRLMEDMDRWGYSFRLGSTARWFTEDAEDARQWLIDKALITTTGLPTFQLRNGD